MRVTPPVRAVGEHAGQPRIGAPLGIEAACDDQLGKSECGPGLWERPKDLNRQASACVATTSDVSPHGALRVASTFCGEPARMAGAAWLLAQWVV